MKHNQTEILFDFLVKNPSGISNAEALGKLRIGSVSRRINDLEEKNVRIDRETIHEHGTHYTRYKLNKEWRDKYISQMIEKHGREQIEAALGQKKGEEA